MLVPCALVRNNVMRAANCVTAPRSYPSTCKLVFDAFSCRDISSTISVLRADTRIDCNSPAYTPIWYEAAVMVVVFIVGVPLYWLHSLHKHRADIQAVGEDGEASVAAQQFSFLVGAYKPEYYMWEVAEMWRKVILTGLVSLVDPGSMVQIMVAASLSLGFAMTHSRCYPFKTMQANFLKLTADTALVLDFLITAVMRNAETRIKFLHTDDLNQEDVLGPSVLSSLMVIISVGMPAVIMIYNHGKCRQTLPEDEEQDTATRMEMQDMSAERHKPPPRLLQTADMNTVPAWVRTHTSKTTPISIED